TRESIRHAASLLNPGGVILLSFEAQKPYISDRMATVLEEVLGSKPLTFRLPRSAYGWGGVLFVTGDQATVDRQLAADPHLQSLVQQWQQAEPITLTGTTKVISDDWPYVYLEKPTVPVLYFLLTGVLVVLFVRGMRKLEAPELIS